MPPKPRRTYGSGSISQRADGLWIGAFQAGWTARGTRRRIKVSAKTKAECARKLKEALRAYNEKGAPAEGVNTRATVKSWAEEWLELTSRTLRPMTWKTNKGCVDKWIIPAIGHKRLDALTPGDMRAVGEAQRNGGLAPSSILRTHAVLSKMLRAASVDGYRINDGIFLMSRPSTNESGRGAIPIEDSLAILRVANAMPDGSRWVAALLQGVRQSEALGLTWDRVDLDNGLADISWQLQSLPYADRKAKVFRVPDGFQCIQVHKALHLTRPKTERGKRIVPLIPPMVVALRAWREIAPPNPHKLVWPRCELAVAYGNPRTAHTDIDQWFALQDAAQVANVDGTIGRRYYVHEARHTAATLLMAAGISQEVIKSILGHSSVVTTQGYQHASQELKRAALSEVGRMLELDK